MGNTTFPDGRALEVLSIWQQTSHELSVKHTLEMEVWCINEQDIKLSPREKQLCDREEALWWKYIVENKSLCLWEGSHSLFVHLATWTESLWSNRRVINIMLLRWAAATLTSISKWCSWFGAFSYLCTANTQNQTTGLSKQAEQTGRAVVGTQEWSLFMRKSRAKGRGFSL